MMDAIVDHGHGLFDDDGVFVLVITKEVNVSDCNVAEISSLMILVMLYDEFIVNMCNDILNV